MRHWSWEADTFLPTTQIKTNERVLPIFFFQSLSGEICGWWAWRKTSWLCTFSTFLETTEKDMNLWVNLDSYSLYLWPLLSSQVPQQQVCALYNEILNIKDLKKSKEGCENYVAHSRLHFVSKKIIRIDLKTCSFCSPAPAACIRQWCVFVYTNESSASDRVRHKRVALLFKLEKYSFPQCLCIFVLKY